MQMKWRNLKKILGASICGRESKAASQNDYLYRVNRYIDENKSWIYDEPPMQPIIIKSLITAFPCNG